MTEDNQIDSQTQEIITTKPASNYLTPLAILVGFGMVAGSIFMSSDNNTAQVAQGNNQPTQAVPKPSGTTDDVRAVTAKDHIKGNPNAPVMVVEYSDYECPFCKRFHDTMNQVMDEQGESGEVAWVFRHFPLDQLHSKARPVAIASECANEQGGNDSFWKFTDRYMELTLSNDRTPIETVIPKIVNELGLNESDFQTCFDSGKFNDHVQEDLENAIQTGGRGTPWSVVIAPNGKTFPLNGAQPLAAVNQLIDIAVKEK